MKQGIKYTPEQKALLLSDIDPRELAAMPIFEGRSHRVLASSRSRFRVLEYEKKKPAKIEKAKPVPLYQFITLAEATPERVKQW